MEKTADGAMRYLVFAKPGYNSLKNQEKQQWFGSKSILPNSLINSDVTLQLKLKAQLQWAILCHPIFSGIFLLIWKGSFV